MARDSEERVGARAQAGKTSRAALFDSGSASGAARAAASLAAIVPGLRLLIGLSIAAILIAALYFGRSLLIPLALAALLGFLLDWPVRQLCRWRLPRALSVFLVVSLAVGALVGAGIYVTGQLTALSQDLPTYQSTIRDKLHVLREAATKPGAWAGALKTLQTVQKEIDIAPPQGGKGVAGVQKVEVIGAESRPTRVALDWLGRISEPVATAGIALLFVILMLMDRRDLRDRLLRLAGGDLHTATDAMDEASARIGRYLRMQFLINASYGVPLGLGLWWIGVPAAALWGFVAAVMRFVPYVGPIVSAVFPLALAFAVSPDWSMVLWTLALIVGLELVCANLVEPWLYGSSTGLSAMSIIVAAMFWTALWGPLGLILSTPLTVCLLVIGRYLPSLHFLHVLLGSESALAPPQRLYQRLLAGDVEEALDLADEVVEQRRATRDGASRVSDALSAFYGEVAVPMLRIATAHHAGVASAEHRLRLASGTAELVKELREQYPPSPDALEGTPRVLCLGARWEVDVLAAAMIAHALELRGLDAQANSQAILSASSFELPPDGHRPQMICLSVFGTQPQARVRLIARRLRRRLPGARIVVAAWSAPADMLAAEMPRRLGVDAVVADLGSLLLHVDHLSTAGTDSVVPIPPDDAARVQALHLSGALSPAHDVLYEDTIRRVANAFDTKYAEISWVDAEHVHKPASAIAAGGDGVPRERSVCAHVVGANLAVVVADLARDPRFADSSLLHEYGIRFYAGAPIRDRDGRALGALCILDAAPREMKPADLDLLAQMADELMKRVQEQAGNGGAG